MRDNLSRNLAIICGSLIAIGFTVFVGQFAALSAGSSRLTPAHSAASSSGEPLVEPFYVRAQGAAGPLKVYDMAEGTARFTLPAGMPSADWSHYFAATATGDETLLQAFNPATGLTENSFLFEGAWSLSGVSPTGRWLALTRQVSPAEQARWQQEERWQTEIQIVETTSGQVTQSLNLAGNFEVETLSSKGDALFLIQHLPAVNPTQYLVRLYDLSQQRLQPGTLRAKTATDEVMTGLAWGGVASVDGQWLLTLYLNTARNTAFVHALNLESKFPVCIDLPSGEGEFAQLKHYSLALAHDSQTVYAANPALGVVAEVSLTEFKVVRASEFTPSALPQGWLKPADIPTNYSVLSPDVAMLYFSSGWDVWGYNPSSGQVVGPYLTGADLRGLGLSKNGRQLYLAHREAQPQIIDLADEKAISLK